MKLELSPRQSWLLKRKYFLQQRRHIAKRIVFSDFFPVMWIKVSFDHLIQWKRNQGFVSESVLLLLCLRITHTKTDSTNLLGLLEWRNRAWWAYSWRTLRGVESLRQNEDFVAHRWGGALYKWRCSLLLWCQTFSTSVYSKTHHHQWGNQQTVLHFHTRQLLQGASCLAWELWRCL